MGLYSFHTTAAPLTTVPPPVLRFSSLGPDKAIYTKSGNLVESMLLSTGQTLYRNNTVTTELDPAHNNAEVLVCGYAGFMLQDGPLPAQLYGNGARDFLAVVQAPINVDRELFGYGTTQFEPMQLFDEVSLPTRQDAAVNGVGIHMLANDGTKPNIPTKPDYMTTWTTYQPDYAPATPIPGLITITDGIDTKSLTIAGLSTGTKGTRKGLSMGAGAYELNLGFAGTIRFLYLDLFDVVLTAAEKALHLAAVKQLFNL